MFYRVFVRRSGGIRLGKRVCGFPSFFPFNAVPVAIVTFSLFLLATRFFRSDHPQPGNQNIGTLMTSLHQSLDAAPFLLAVSHGLVTILSQRYNVLPTSDSVTKRRLVYVRIHLFESLQSDG
jgi:hypothetical protein